MIITYNAIFEYDSDGICISFPDIPEANTCGFSDPEAVKMAQEVIILAMHGKMISELPKPTTSDKITLNKKQKIYPISAGFEIQDGKLFNKNVKSFPTLHSRKKFCIFNFIQCCRMWWKQ